MRLFGSLASPFVRKARAAAIELELGDLDLVETAVKPTQPNRRYGADVNPVRRVPALETPDAGVLTDSALIVEYLDARAGGGRLIPAAGPERFRVLNRAAVASGATDALVLAMYEGALRPEPLRWTEWRVDQIDKAAAALDWFEEEIAAFPASPDAASLALGCLLGYARFRFPDLHWFEERHALRAWWEDHSTRPCFARTAPPAA